MAVSEALPGVEVTVNVASQPLQEYIEIGVPDEPRTTTRYIEATSNQAFEIHAKIPEDTTFDGDCLRVDIRVDDKWIDAFAFNPKGVLSRACRGPKLPSAQIKLLRWDVLESGMHRNQPYRVTESVLTQCS